MIFVTSDTAHIVVPWRADIANLIPHARAFEHAGVKHLLLPNKHDEAKVARNLGVPVPSPILTRYDWPGRSAPWNIQKTTSALLTESPRCYVLSTMGTGKTRAVVYAADYLRMCCTIKRTLIVAPLSTLTPVWEAELFSVLPGAKVRVLYGSKAKRLKLLAEDADFYVINPHGLHVIQAALVARKFDLIVLDELAVYRTKSTQLWKTANAIVNAPSTKFAWGLTGSPTPTAPTDAWAQVKLLTPERVARTMAQFQDQTMRKVAMFRFVARKDANDVVHAAMQPSVRYRREDVMELPPTTYVDRDVKLGPDAARAYQMLFDKMRMITSNGESITAVNEGVLIGKLLQVSCGYLYTDKHTVHELPSPARFAALNEVIAETDRKCIVFAPFLHALSGIAAHLRKAGRNVGVVNGSVSRASRDRIFTAFQDPANEMNTIVAHPQCMSHGLTLTAANTIIWFSPTTSLETYEQSNARITRPSQTSKTLIVHLSGTAVERATYARLREKGRMQGILLNLFHQQSLEF